MQNPTFSVVVISFNGKEFLRSTLGAVSRSEVKPLQIIVVDDASSDGTAGMVTQEFPDVGLVKNGTNSGVTVSRNRGASRANGDYIIFLDNDIEVRPDTFQKLVAFMEAHADAGIATARLFSEDGSQRWWNVGYDPNNFRAMLGYLFRSPRLDLNYWDHASVRAVDWVVEECFIMRQPLFEKLGGFDEDFFMYCEGPDLCKRVRNAGYKVYFTPDATAVVHEGHAHSSERRANLFTQSRYRYYQKHYFYLKSNPLLFWLVEKLKR